MNELESILEEGSRQAKQRLQNTVAWFHLKLLQEPGGAQPNTALSRKERLSLPLASGPREKQALAQDAVTKKTLLKAQLYDIVEATLTHYACGTTVCLHPSATLGTPAWTLFPAALKILSVL